MSKPHPHPLKSKIRDFEEESVVGYFMIGFNDNPDHEYSYYVLPDGLILPEMLDEKSPRLFAKELTDPNLHHVRFIQANDRNVEHDPWRPE